MPNFTGKRPISPLSRHLGAEAGVARSEPVRDALRRAPPAQVPEWQFEVGESWRASDHRMPGERSSDAVRRITAELRDYFEKRTQRG